MPRRVERLVKPFTRAALEEAIGRAIAVSGGSGRA